jgi:hypothetical protein
MFHIATRPGTVQVWIKPKDGSFDVVSCNNRLGPARRLDRVQVAGTDIAAALDNLIALVNQWQPW